MQLQKCRFLLVGSSWSWAFSPSCVFLCLAAGLWGRIMCQRRVWFDAIINSVGMTSSVCKQQCWVAEKLKIHHIYWNKKLQINFQAYFEQSEAFFTEKRYSLYLNVYVLLNSLKPYEVETDGQIGTNHLYVIWCPASKQCSDFCQWAHRNPAGSVFS